MDILAAPDKQTRVFRVEHLGPRGSTIEELESVASSNHRIHVVSLAGDPGVSRLIMALENKYFHPDSSRADDMKLFIVMWEGIPFWLISIPIEYTMELDQQLSMCGLVMVEGVPMLLDNGVPVSHFPIRSNIMTVKTSSDHPRPLGGLGSVIAPMQNDLLH